MSESAKYYQQRAEALKRERDEILLILEHLIISVCKISDQPTFGDTENALAFAEKIAAKYAQKIRSGE